MISEKDTKIHNIVPRCTTLWILLQHMYLHRFGIRTN